MDMHFGFDNITEAFAQMRAMEEEANARVVPRQRQIDWGSYFIRPQESLGLIVFAYCETEEEIVAGERRYGASLDEASRTLETLQDSHERGYRYGRHYSLIEPEGELGSTHIVKCWPITEEQFHQAKELGWDARLILEQHPWLADALLDLRNSQVNR